MQATTDLRVTGDLAGRPGVGDVPSRIEADGAGRLRVLAANEYSGRELRLDAVDTVVLACGARAVDGLYAALKGARPGHAPGR